MNEKQYLQDMERDTDRRKAKALNIKVQYQGEIFSDHTKINHSQNNNTSIQNDLLILKVSEKCNIWGK